MEKSVFVQFCSKKAFEISYALFRVAGNIQHKSFAEHLEKQALALLDAAIGEIHGETQKVLHTAEYFIRLGTAIGLVSFKNSQMLLKELSGLDSAIAEFGNSQILPELNLEGVFSDKTSTFVPRDVQKHQDEESRHLEKHESVNGSEVERSSANAAMRQSEILQKIRQSGSCRFKDIQDAFPGTSERTIRYDLQKLAEQGIIRRIGSGGPGTSYELMNSRLVANNYPQDTS